ncbi:MAG: polysaccharide biosynthesis/export family protein [Cyclobacteriaceae bacterium]|jgi:polysaccharide export outer membrane protein|nr:polysaccharide biosynthesis/export family protein [Cyclobacteriaceae bacterium]
MPGRILWFLLTLVALASCVPNKKVLYLQKDDVNKKDMKKDTVLRTYDMVIHEYKIQPLDILSIRLESLTDPEFDFMTKLLQLDQMQGGGNQQNMLVNGFLVDQNGDLEFPVVGKIKLSGLSLFEAQEKLQELFKPYLKDPVARIRLLNFRFTVLGEVNRENQIVSQNVRVTLMEAIGLAGGLTDLADRSSVKIIRQRGDQVDVLYMNLLEEDLLATENYYVQQNDIIVVPPLKQRPFRKYWTENIAIIVSTLSLVLLVISLAQNN